VKNETPVTETVTCPRGAILDAWSDSEWNNGVQIDQMEELTTFAVQTRNSLARLPVRDAILDGELVCLDADGRSQFMDLMRRQKDACYYAFDLLWLNGTDLRQEPLVERKARLRKLVRGRPGIRRSSPRWRRQDIPDLLCSGSGGHRDQAARGPYSATPCSWLKVINPNYRQHRGRREMFERFRQRMPA
jgi:hypothetical protein